MLFDLILFMILNNVYKVKFMEYDNNCHKKMGIPNPDNLQLLESHQEGSNQHEVSKHGLSLLKTA